MEFKYIIIKKVFYVLFCDGIEHIAEANGRNVTSAGRCRITVVDGEIDVHCFGESLSLGIPSDPVRDAAIIKRGAINAFSSTME